MVTDHLRRRRFHEQVGAVAVDDRSNATACSVRCRVSPLVEAGEGFRSVRASCTFQAWSIADASEQTERVACVEATQDVARVAPSADKLDLGWT